MEGLLWFSGVSFTHILYSAFRTAYHDMDVANRMTPPQQPSSSSHSDAIEASVPLPLPTNVHELYQAIENRIQRDEGSRRIKDLVVEGELERIAEALSITAITNVVIITGFSCLIEHTPPTETDGPLGALAIARALLCMGKCVKIVTDECNEEVLLIATATSDLIRSFGSSRLTLESFPPQANFDSGDVQRLKECAEWADSVIAIERPGPNSDGEYKTMKGISMDHLVAPLEDIIGYRMNLPGNIISDFNNIDADGDVDVESKEKPINYSFLSIGIGDGGNEIGMGKVYDKIINSSSIPLGKDIACVVATKYLLTSSVSNWGGYAVAAALCIHHIRSQSQFHSPSIYRQFRRDSVSKYIVSPETEVKICTSMVESGARDGVSGQMEVSVDGMPFSVSIQVLNDLVILCLSESIVWS